MEGDGVCPSDIKQEIEDMCQFRGALVIEHIVKYARSTFVMKSANNKQQLPDMMMNQRQDAEQQAMFDVTNKAKRQLKRVETIVSK